MRLEREFVCLLSDVVTFKQPLVLPCKQAEITVLCVCLEHPASSITSSWQGLHHEEEFQYYKKATSGTPYFTIGPPQCLYRRIYIWHWRCGSEVNRSLDDAVCQWHDTSTENGECWCWMCTFCLTYQYLFGHKYTLYIEAEKTWCCNLFHKTMVMSHSGSVELQCTVNTLHCKP